MMDDYNGHGWDMGWGGWLMFTVMMLLLVALVVAVVVALLRYSEGPGGQGGQGDRAGPLPPPTGPDDRDVHRAEELLAQRYARGEIDENEYLHRRAVLRGR